jgi:hypothetical protein
MVRRDIAIMQSRIETGDIGITDASRQRKMLAVLRHYTLKDLPPKRKLKDQKFKDKHIVTREYIQVYTAGSMAFQKFRGGPVQALDLTIRTFIDLGYLAEYDKARSIKDFGTSGKCYQILNLPDIDVGEEK